MKTEFTMAKKPQHTYSIAMVEQDLKLSKSRKMMLNPCDFKIFEGDILACVISKSDILRLDRCVGVRTSTHTPATRYVHPMSEHHGTRTPSRHRGVCALPEK